MNAMKSSWSCQYSAHLSIAPIYAATGQAGLAVDAVPGWHGVGLVLHEMHSQC